MGGSCLIQGFELKESFLVYSDHGLHFKGEIEKLLRKFNIQHHKFSPYRPQTNGAVGAANKNIGRILKKGMKNYKDWHLQLPYAL